MDAYWWPPHAFASLWVVPIGFVLICLLFLFAYLFRSPGSLCGRRERHEFCEAAREILDRRYASGEISAEQYKEMKRVLAS